MIIKYVVVNDYSNNAAFEADKQIGFFISILKSSLSDYCDVIILVKRIITIEEKEQMQ